MMAQFTATGTGTGTGSRALAQAALGLALASGLGLAVASAQNLPVTPQQRSTAQQVAQAGVPLSELADGAPDDYTVKRGDTLWAISGLFLKSPWRWPELWGMNLQEIANPHRIYPGQQLHLERKDGLARLRAGPSPTDGGPMPTVKVTPGTRITPLPDPGLATLQPHLIEPFLAEPAVVDPAEMERAPRIVAAGDNRVLLTRGDRAYARGEAGAPLRQKVAGRVDTYRIFRNARPIKDPGTGEVLGYEAQYLGKAQLVRDEGTQAAQPGSDAPASVVPATIDIVFAKEEMRVGDRLLPEPPRQFTSYVPRPPERPVEGRIVSVYGDAVSMSGQNQVVVINRGSADGMATGHVLALRKDGATLLDRTKPGERTPMKLPDERNGLMMVFLTFEKLSYALVLEITDIVRIGDRFTSPR